MSYEITKGFFSGKYGLKIDGKRVVKNKYKDSCILNQFNTNQHNSDDYIAFFNTDPNDRLNRNSCSIYSTKEKHFIVENVPYSDYTCTSKYLTDSWERFGYEYLNQYTNPTIKGIVLKLDNKPCYIYDNKIMTGNYDRIEIESHKCNGYCVYAIDKNNEMIILDKNAEYKFAGISCDIFIQSVEKPGLKPYGIFNVTSLEELVDISEKHVLDAKFLALWIDSYFEKLTQNYPEKEKQYVIERENFYKKAIPFMKNLTNNINNRNYTSKEISSKVKQIREALDNIEKVKETNEFTFTHKKMLDKINNNKNNFLSKSNTNKQVKTIKKTKQIETKTR